MTIAPPCGFLRTVRAGKSWWMEVLEHQREALNEITARARAYFRNLHGDYYGDWRNLPITARWASLITGPSGSGKTAVAAMAAAKLSEEAKEATEGAQATVSLCRVSASSYIPLGAQNRGAKETIGVIASHVAKHERTILFVDELDKLVDRDGDTSWKSYIRGELFDLIDGRWPFGMKDSDGDELQDTAIAALTEKLRNSVFFLAAGTFQDWFDGANSRRTMGFGAEINPGTDELSAEIIAERMGRELANRLNSSFICLPELRADDYHRIAREAEYKLPERMQAAFRGEVAKRITGAIAAKKGVRFLEEAMMATLINLPPEPTTVISEFVKLGFSPNDFEPCTL